MAHRERTTRARTDGASARAPHPGGQSGRDPYDILGQSSRSACTHSPNVCCPPGVHSGSVLSRRAPRARGSSSTLFGRKAGARCRSGTCASSTASSRRSYASVGPASVRSPLIISCLLPPADYACIGRDKTQGGARFYFHGWDIHPEGHVCRRGGACLPVRRRLLRGPCGIRSPAVRG